MSTEPDPISRTPDQGNVIIPRGYDLITFGEERERLLRLPARIPRLELINEAIEAGITLQAAWCLDGHGERNH